MLSRILILCVLCFSINLADFVSAEELVLRYDSPATDWEKEALPIGNGRIGAMVFGGVGEEVITLN
jgi:alpha-L-fucosidase 2